MTINKELLQDLPNLEVFRGGSIYYYFTEDISHGEISLLNISDEDDEWYLNIKNLAPTTEDLGSILNYEEYLFSLEELQEKQSLLDMISLKKAGLI